MIEYSEFVAKFGLQTAPPTPLSSSTSGESKMSSGSGGENQSAPPPPAPEPWMEEFVTGMGAAMQR